MYDKNKFKFQVCLSHYSAIHFLENDKNAKNCQQ